MSGELPALEEVPCLCCGADGGSVVATSRAQLSSAPTRFQFVRCDTCDLIRLNPRVPAAGIGDWYDRSYLPHRGASAWGRYARFVERAQAGQDRARVRRVRSAVRLTPQSRVLDVGCGRPTFLESLQRTTGAQSVGLDFTNHGWRDDPDRWRPLQLHEGELNSVRLKPGFDAVTLWHALEHEYDPVASLVRLRELTRPGGVLVVEVPNADSLTRWLHGDQWAGFHTPRHTTVFTPPTLRSVLVRAGWQVQRVLPYGTLDPYVLWWLGRQERLQRDLNGDLSSLFAGFLAGRIVASPLLWLRRWVSLGIQTAIAVRC